MIDDPKALEDSATVGRARKAASMAISKWVMSTAMTSWAENSGSAIRDLIRHPIPDTQKVFLRQSNGAENADRIGNVAVGQTDVITRGNDTGAFGKCAPYLLLLQPPSAGYPRPPETHLRPFKSRLTRGSAQHRWKWNSF